MTATIAALNASALRDLVRPVEPLASVYLGLEPATATVDVLEDLDLRWRVMASRLAELGTPPSTVDVLGYYIAALPVYPTEMALFASDGQIRLAHEIAGGAPFDSVRYAAPAHILPLLAWLQAHPAYVEVVIDRTGAEITAVRAGAAAGHTETVTGPDDEIERNAPGGWAQPRYQRRAEDSWRHNAAAVAEAATHALRRVHANLLLVAGDVRAVQLLRERLPEASHLRVQSVPGGRGRDGSEPVRRTAVAAARAAHGDNLATAALAAFVNASRGAAVQGPDDTLATLAAGQVRNLLIANNPGDHRVAWFGPELLCATAPRLLTGAADLRPGRLGDIAIRAALLTDAQITIVDSKQLSAAGGIGGLCRYT